MQDTTRLPPLSLAGGVIVWWGLASTEITCMASKCEGTLLPGWLYFRLHAQSRDKNAEKGREVGQKEEEGCAQKEEISQNGGLRGRGELPDAVNSMNTAFKGLERGSGRRKKGTVRGNEKDGRRQDACYHCPYGCGCAGAYVVVPAVTADGMVMYTVPGGAEEAL